ncbi:MAG: erythromycin esterase family protein [Chryseobacterium sp.]|nr:MAG: erythromycin esterase family protein [Chryseobacterium sp.]
MKILHLITIYLLLAIPGQAQPNQNMDAWLARNAIVQSPDSLFQFSKFNSVPDFLSDKKIIAIGEPTHGSKDAQVLRSELLKYLVTYRGFRTLALEAFDKSGAANDYLIHGKGTASTPAKSLSMWFFNSEQTVELLSWMRNFNLTHPDKVRVFGTDVNYKFDFKSFKDSLVQVNALDLKLVDSISAIDEQYLLKENPIPKNIARQLKSMVDHLNDQVLQNEKPISKAVSPRYFEFLKYSLLTYRQAIGGFILGNSGPEYYRDSCMASNVGYIATHFSVAGKVLYAAHNGHIQKDRNYRHQTTGMFLANKYGKQYYAIGLQFSDLKFKSLGWSKDLKRYMENTFSVSTPKQGSFAALMMACKTESFFIDFESAQKDKQFDFFFNQRRPVLYVGWYFEPPSQSYYYDKKSLTELFDGLIYLKKSSEISFLAKE